ncbi:MAG: YfhO family protein [Dysgonamonadaceae bacterium]|nr:YfhO family protein [Dysgonamonadaceae bacterium]MDD3308532.1 YfhO family protein [Dysgonamonadaceae bacterium]MDD3899933.1 YfhO family protein [Dysgonamonadaceae bacterium]MDD4398708.1 YfhO family protein [Dysgonamonadaceae bacterium]
MKKSNSLKRMLPDLIMILAFILISFIYFAPAVFDGRVITQSDSLAAIGQGQEQVEYMSRHNGERTRWINSMFSGMPTYQMSPTYDSSKPQDTIKQLYQLFLPQYVALLFIMLMGFYILMRAFKANPLISALGAIIWAFSSYFFILIDAGHIWKFTTLAYIPPTIAGLIYIYRKQYLLGSFLFMLFVAFQISANHLQMTYYFLFVMIFIVIALLVDAIRKKEVPSFLKSTAVLIIAGVIGVLANSSNLYHTYEYSKETMRGKSELTHHGAENKSDGGLERDYITQWSYGIDETLTLLVPNTKGGASIPISENEKAMSKARPEYRQLYSQIGQYWGEQPGTSGPVYVGAFVLMLFILGLFIVKGPMKWAMLIGTIFSILLSWGHNFMGLTDFFIDYVPLYNKFRTVSSILVIAEFCIPVLAIFALKEIIEHPETIKNNMKQVYISLGLTGGLALIMALLPKLFFSSFISGSEMQAFQSLPSEHIQPIIGNLTDMRISMFTADAWRSVLITVLGTLFIWLFVNNKLNAKWSVFLMLILCLGDMWSINKRYLNDSDFHEQSQRQQIFAQTPTDQYIMQDTTKYYRVLNLATSTFNDGVTPYYHKAIGGYHAAKLRRYQDLIDVHLGKEMIALQKDIIQSNGVMDSVNAEDFKVLNMLNSRWTILPAQGGGTIPVLNPHAQGNAWFVDNITFTETADEEIETLGKIDLHSQAVADKKYASILGGFNVTPKDSASTISLTSYDSNILTYQANAKKDELAVFSEIYYPKGWQITIDGKPTEMLRVNYTLRALVVPEGEHTIVFKFDPQSIKVTDTIAYISLGIMLLVAICFLYRFFKRLQKDND